MNSWEKHVAGLQATAKEAVDKIGKATEHLPSVGEMKEAAQAEFLKATKMFDSEDKSDFEVLNDALIGIISAIRQVSEGHANKLVGIAIGKMSGAAAAGGVAGLIGAFGTASTGTAIGTLSGAALTTAKLYWVGSIIGMGTAAGGVILGGTGIGIGLAAVYATKKIVTGLQRNENAMQDYEKNILIAATALITAIQHEIDIGKQPSKEELEFISQNALRPMITEINIHKTYDTLEVMGVNDQIPFSENLTALNYRKLKQNTAVLKTFLQEKQ